MWLDRERHLLCGPDHVECLAWRESGARLEIGWSPEGVARAPDGIWWFTSGVPGDSTTVAGPTWSNAVSWADVASADLTGDGLPDLVGRAQESGET